MGYGTSMTPKQLKEQEVEDALQRERDERAARPPRDGRSPFRQRMDAAIAEFQHHIATCDGTCS